MGDRRGVGRLSGRARAGSAAARAVLLVGVMIALVATVPDAGAASWTAGACPTSSGVTVVVDFQGLGGGVVVRCAPGAQESGFAALESAGFSIASATRSMGFLCRIDGKPSAASDSCVDPSPPDAYWAFFTAPRGGSWKYSSTGALTPGTAPEGGVQGWSFSDGTNPPPGAPPPANGTTSPPTTRPPTTVAPTTRPSSTNPPANPPAAAPSGGTPGGTPGGLSGGPGSSPVPTAPGQNRPVGTAPDSQPTTGVDPSNGADTTAAPGPGVSVDVLGAVESATTTIGGDGTTDAEGTGDAATDGPSREQLTIELAAAADAGGGTGDSGGSPMTTLAGVGVVAALGAVGAVAHRRRSVGTRSDG